MLLNVCNLKKSCGKRNLVDSLSFSVNSSQIVALLGPNGAGKSVTFYMVMGFIAPNGGSISFMGSNITTSPVHKRVKMGITYLPQEPSVFRKLSVEENILCVLELSVHSSKDRKRKARSLLEEFQLSHLANKSAATLSGGERRRLEIARSLVTDPKLLLLDEPFASVDPISINNIKAIVQTLSKKGIGVLITDHNAREVGSIADHVYLIQGGRVTHSGNIDAIVKDQSAREKYFGIDFVP